MEMVNVRIEPERGARYLQKLYSHAVSAAAAGADATDLYLSHDVIVRMTGQLNNLISGSSKRLAFFVENARVERRMRRRHMDDSWTTACA